MIIDIHSHLGKMLRRPEADIEDYYNTMQNEQVDISFLFPLPYQVAFDDPERVFLKYTLEGRKPVFFSDVLDQLRNPYHIINEHFFNVINRFDPKDKEIMFVPIIHPILDDPKTLHMMIERYDPPALKLHGTGSGVVPSDFTEEMMQVIRERNIPLIIHTDFSRIKTQNYIDKTNTALNWANWAIDNGIYVCLAHGARLQPEALKLVNHSKYLSIGIAPIQRVSRNKDRLASDLPSYTPIEYLRFLFNYMDHRKIMFDLDYNWNRMPDTNIPDYSSSNLVKQVFGVDQDFVFYKNAVSFFSKLTTKSHLLDMTIDASTDHERHHLSD